MGLSEYQTREIIFYDNYVQAGFHLEILVWGGGRYGQAK